MQEPGATQNRSQGPSLIQAPSRTSHRCLSIYNRGTKDYLLVSFRSFLGQADINSNSRIAISSQIQVLSREWSPVWERAVPVCAREGIHPWSHSYRWPNL